MQAQVSSLFDGLSPEQLDQLRSSLRRRRFAAGDAVIAEGDNLREMYIIESGAADVFITDRLGEHLINRVGAGTTLGDISLITGQAASATVRAATPLDVLVMSEAEFRRTAAAFPLIYQNLGAILAERLAHSSRRAATRSTGRLTILHDDGAPPLLGYALACSMAWHARAAVLLLVVQEQEPAVELAALAEAAPWHGRTRPGAGTHRHAQLVVTHPTGAFAPEVLWQTLEDLSSSYDYVLLQVRDAVTPGVSATTVRLGAPSRRTAQPAGSVPTEEFAIVGWSQGRRPRPDREGLLHVPELNAADEQALRGGLLPLTTPAGQAIGWAARDRTGMKVGVALGGGASKGFAHIGVMDVLCQAGIPVDYLAGTSIGAVVASLWATDRTAREAARVLTYMAETIFRPALPLRALLSSTALRARVMRLAQDWQIEDTTIPLAIVATDILSLEEVVMRRGPIGPALIGSTAIPGIFPPQPLGERLLVDGGVLNPVPSNVAAAMGADVVIAVRLGGVMASSPTVAPSGRHRAPRLTIFHTITRTLDLMQSKMAADTASAATIVIEPELGDINVSLLRFAEGRRYIAGGRAAARAALPRIATALPWLQES